MKTVIVTVVLAIFAYKCILPNVTAFRGSIDRVAAALKPR